MIFIRVFISILSIIPISMGISMSLHLISDIKRIGFMLPDIIGIACAVAAFVLGATLIFIAITAF